MNANPHVFPPEEVMAYLDGELSPERSAVISAHLETCAECSALATNLRGVSRQMRAWEVEQFPSNLVDRLTAFAAEERAELEHLPSSTWEPRRSTAFKWVLGLASGFAVLLLLAIFERDRPEGSVSHVGWTTEGMWRSKMSTNEASQSQQRAAEMQGSFREEQDKAKGGVLPLSPMIARTAELKLIVARLNAAREEMDRVLRVRGGYAGDLTMSEPDGVTRNLSATLRIPSGQLDAALAELKRLGRVEHESQQGEEVTQQYVDLRARLENTRATEQRLIELLRTRTGKVGDILEVEKEIARVREEIERMDAERKSLATRVQFATVKLQIAEEYKQPLNLTAPSAGTRLWNALASGCRDAVETGLAIVLFILNYGPTFILLAALFSWPVRLAWRRLRPAQRVTTGA